MIIILVKLDLLSRYCENYKLGKKLINHYQNKTCQNLISERSEVSILM